MTPSNSSSYNKAKRRVWTVERVDAKAEWSAGSDRWARKPRGCGTRETPAGVVSLVGEVGACHIPDGHNGVGGEAADPALRSGRGGQCHRTQGGGARAAPWPAAAAVVAREVSRQPSALSWSQGAGKMDLGMD
jgi:hypothetical protein